MTMLNVFDLQKRKTAVLHNAFSIVETQELNKVYTLEFSLPDSDEKIKYCQPFHYVRYGDNGQFYRIIQSSHDDSDSGIIKFNCEHVITTLCDTLMFGSFTYGGESVHTREVIEWLLEKQNVKNWVLDICDFDRQFEYGWEQENILNALYAIPKEFSSPYKWTFDTSSYPWKLSLQKIDETVHPEFYLRAKRNLLSSDSESNNADICTRIYPLGYGEGVNQLTIKDVNDGVPYLQAPDSIVEKYGIIEKVLVDRRFEKADTLKAFAQTTLDSLSNPGMTRSFDVVDLYEITGTEIDYAEVGKICKLTGDGTITYITKTQRTLDKAGDLQIELSTKATDVASTIADLAERVRIEAVYAQGATQLYQHSKDANATKEKGAILSLYFPQEMKQINKVLMRMQLKPFRAYSQSTSAGGADSTTSEGGSASGQTGEATNPGGGSISLKPSISVTISDTGDANWKSRAGINFFYTNPDSATGYTDSKGEHKHNIKANTGETTPPESANYKHYHAINYTDGALSSGKHTHDVTVNSHSHRIYCNTLQHNHSINASADVKINNNESGQSGFSHTHSFNIGAHTHVVPLPNHTHNIEAGIFEFGNPSSCDIYISGTKKAHIDKTSFDGDIAEWLLDSNGTIPRGSWIDLEIRPNDKAYVVTSIFIQGFVQSRGGGNY